MPKERQSLQIGVGFRERQHLLPAGKAQEDKRFAVQSSSGVGPHARRPVNLQLTEEQELLQRGVREFVEREVKPIAKELDETGRFPREIIRKAGELGLTGIAVPESHGGAGM